MIDTILGPMDEEKLSRETVAFDGPKYYAFDHIYSFLGNEVARYRDIKWEKRNDFEESPGVVKTSRGDMPLDKLEKRIGHVDNATEYNCWVEYLPLGEDEIVHRSVHTKLKIPPAPIYAYAGKVR